LHRTLFIEEGRVTATEPARSPLSS
jgi:hypothetical protein